MTNEKIMPVIYRDVCGDDEELLPVERKTCYFTFADILGEKIYRNVAGEREAQAVQLDAAAMSGFFFRIQMTPERAADPVVVICCATGEEPTQETITAIDKAITERMLAAAMLTIDQVIHCSAMDYNVQIVSFKGE